ncbi:Mitosis inhibitor protein kinase SWE1 [Nakaseomyces glabratus]|nr:Mitosis inhibitor protein kinase SWE1 [Nakaseomyces glabratus]KTB24978.1 Mitosis inhibitor protein kinase SWE1 [Nakaseomyces glabratus]
MENSEFGKGLGIYYDFDQRSDGMVPDDPPQNNDDASSMDDEEMNSYNSPNGSNRLKFYPYSNNSMTRSVATLNLSISNSHNQVEETLPSKNNRIRQGLDFGIPSSNTRLQLPAITKTTVDYSKTENKNFNMETCLNDWSPFNYNGSSSSNSSKSELSPFVNNPETLKKWNWMPKQNKKHGKPLDKANIIITQTPRNTSKNHPDFEIAKPDPSAFETSGLKPKSLLNTAQKLAVPNTPVKKSPLIDTGNTFSSASRVADSSILEFSTLNYRNSTTGHTSFLFSPSLNKTPVHDKFYNSTGILDDSPLQLSKGQKGNNKDFKQNNVRPLHSESNTPDSTHKGSYKKIKKSRDSVILKNIELSNSLLQFTNDLYDEEENRNNNKENHPTIFESEADDECVPPAGKADDHRRDKNCGLSLHISSPKYNSQISTKSNVNHLITVESSYDVKSLLTPTRTKSIAGAKMTDKLANPYLNEELSSFDGLSPLSSKKKIHNQENPDMHLSKKFEDISIIGQGPFSTVYYVVDPETNKKFAIKSMQIKKKNPIKRILQEINLLTEFQSTNLDEEGKEYIIDYITSWKYGDSYYIMTDFYENGSLDKFLQEQVVSKKTKLEDWRIWKIMVEICLGLRFIHDSCQVVHLDLKPANIFITFEGNLKIGDFGMATHLPLTDKSFENEGDREYIAPEIITDSVYDFKADIFSLGLIMVEIAANVILPDNGNAWHKLRSGDLSDAGRLSSTDIHSESLFSSVTKVEKGNSGLLDYNREVLSQIDSNAFEGNSNPVLDLPHSSTTKVSNKLNSNINAEKQHSRDSIPAWVPKFLIDGESLDNIVKWMIEPNYKRRPSADEILHTEECLYVEMTRKAGAIVQEDDYGPRPEFFQ